MSVAALAVYLREEMGRQNMTQQDLEQATGIPDSTLSRILNGEVSEPRASQIAKIGKALGVEFWILMRKAGIGNGPPSSPTEEAQQIAAIVAGDPGLGDVLRRVSTLNEHNRQAIIAYITLLQQQSGGGSQSPPESE
jgi:transcriptional regulator with XRE-family HTH domain